MSAKLTYGIRDDRLQHIEDVSNGLKCNCICPECHTQLIARNNSTNIREHHFQHLGIGNCSGGVESALHLLAKQVLMDTKTIRTPDFHWDYSPTNSDSFFRVGKTVVFDTMRKEKRKGQPKNEFQPDIIGTIGESELYIEFAVTSYVKREKKKKILKTGRACIEVRLMGFELNEKKLMNLFQSNTQRIYWIVYPDLDKLAKERQLKTSNKPGNPKNEFKSGSTGELSVEEYEEIRQNTLKEAGYFSDELDQQQTGDLNKNIRECPKLSEEVLSLKATRFYQHPILKRIVDGENWDLELFEDSPDGRHIILSGEKVNVYPTYKQLVLLPEEKQKECDLLYLGLDKLSKMVKSYKYINCSSCECRNECNAAINIGAHDL